VLSQNIKVRSQLSVTGSVVASDGECDPISAEWETSDLHVDLPEFVLLLEWQ